MQRKNTMRQVSYLFLCVSPFLIVALAAPRSLRVPWVQDFLGVLVFAFLVGAAWWVSRQPTGASTDFDPRVRLAGLLLLTPFALIALLWVGLGTPWDATPAENAMRYTVLLVGGIAITCAFFLLSRSLDDAGERFYSTLGLATNVLAGGAFVVWASFQLGFYTLLVAQGQLTTAMVSMNNVFDALLFAAGSLAYVTTAALAHSLGEAGWLGRKASAAYAALNLLALIFLVLRGVAFPSPDGVEPWFTQPGFVVGIPAMPWLMPFLLGVVLLRRAPAAGGGAR